jgi:crossover junction endodeoxyribonuclease RuvC
MKAPDYVLGIDPGLHGALALLSLSTHKICDIWDMPTREGKVDPAGVALVVDMAKSIASGRLVAAVENVNSRPHQAHAFSFGLSVGIIHGVLGSLGIPFCLVAPQSWKGSFGLCRVGAEAQSGTKARARELASRLWPEHAVDFKRVMYADRAEAALISRFFASKNSWM